MNNKIRKKTSPIQRLDLELVKRGLVTTRQKAQALIMAGQILVDDSPATKAGANVAEFNNIRIRGEVQKYVSRGGVKLEGALKAFDVLIKDKIALDVGASTGGFSDCLLQSGVAFIYAVDVGHSQLDWKIRSDSRVKVFEKYNAKNLSKSDFDKKIDLVVVDVSFISLQKVFAPIKRISTPETDWITLIKPQFEVGRDKIKKGGVVDDPVHRLEAIEKLKQFAESLGIERLGLIESPITGMDGNVEYLAHWKLKNV